MAITEAIHQTERDHQNISSDEKEAAVDQQQQIETIESFDEELHYDNKEEEPELHYRTYIAIAAVVFLNLVQTFSLNGPPTVLSYIGKAFDKTTEQSWVSNAFLLPQASIGPIIALASDTFQARKTILVGTSIISFIGCAIAPSSGSIYRLIAAQALNGIGGASISLTYVIPSEILPRKWRPMAQSTVQVAAGLGAISGPLIIGGLTRNDPLGGWRKFFWIEMALWGAATLGILLGYRPPKRHTRYDHLSFLGKLARLDIIGSCALVVGLPLFLTGLNLGGELSDWTNARPLSTLVIGCVVLTAFALYEWKGTSTGILHHDLFKGGKSQGRMFAICNCLIAIEATLLFAFIVFYPIMVSVLFETDPFLLACRIIPFAGVGSIVAVLFGFVSTKLRTIRGPMMVGFLIWTGGVVGWAAIQPSNNASSVIFTALAGAGFGAPLILIVVGVQLSTPHYLIATGTAVITSCRSLFSVVFTTIYFTAFNRKLATNLPNQVAPVAVAAGLPATSVPLLIAGLAESDLAALATIPGITPQIISASLVAFKQAFADSVRVVFIIAAPFGIIGVIVAAFLGSVRDTMHYAVDAPIEDLHAKKRRHYAAE